jgi:hypothetical protein
LALALAQVFKRFGLQARPRKKQKGRLVLVAQEAYACRRAQGPVAEQDNPGALDWPFPCDSAQPGTGPR